MQLLQHALTRLNATAPVRHYNNQRPHRSLALCPPRAIEGKAGPDVVTAAARVRRLDRLGGLVHEYYQVAA
jgi:putative transposase